MSKNKNLQFDRGCRRRGVALIMVVMVLVALSAIVYRLGLGVSQWKSRQQYMIDYQKARYGCESGIKYAITTVDELDADYVERPNEPDFSDVFAMSEIQYKEMLAEWAEIMETEYDANDSNKSDVFSLFASLSALGGGGDGNDSNDFNDFGLGLLAGLGESTEDSNQSINEMVLRGPYGPVWPCVAEPIEIDFSDSRVTIEIADENAKLPLTWAISADKDVEDEAAAAVVTFLEWMQMWPDDIELLQEQFEQMADVKAFSVKLKPVVNVVKTKVKVADSRSKRKSSRRRTRRSSKRSKTRTTTKKVARPDIGHNRDFAKLLYSPMLDSESLAVINEEQIEGEAAIKYISRWGTQRVNVNSAPRHVLEAAFTFGGDAVEIADAIIDLRKIKAFKSIDDLKKRLYSYNDSIDKSANYICTESSFYSINVTAVSGLAKISASVGLKKNDKGKIETIGFVME